MGTLRICPHRLAALSLAAVLVASAARAQGAADTGGDIVGGYRTILFATSNGNVSSALPRGFQISVVGRLNNLVSVVGAFGASYGARSAPLPSYDFDICHCTGTFALHEIDEMGGVRFGTKRNLVFVEALVGSVSPGISEQGGPLGEGQIDPRFEANTKFGLRVGGGADIRSKSWYGAEIEAAYNTTLGGLGQFKLNDLQVSVNLLVQLGRH